MCVVCGCGEDIQSSKDDFPKVESIQSHSVHQHINDSTRKIKLEVDLLEGNNKFARQNRAHFQSHRVCTLNLMSSPGSGKTTLLCSTIQLLKKQLPALPISVIEGDQQTELDAQRIRATGINAFQVNTGKGCHLDAKMIANAFSSLHSHEHHHVHHQDHHHHDHDHDIKQELNHPDADLISSLLFIENVGNLVCPALWDLGEHAKVVILSVTEGVDKPLKYPDMFAAAKLMIINKIDLLAHVDFDVELCIEFARRINPNITVIELSATTGVGMDLWAQWLISQMGNIPLTSHMDSSLDIQALEKRRVELENDLIKINYQLTHLANTR